MTLRTILNYIITTAAVVAIIPSTQAAPTDNAKLPTWSTKIVYPDGNPATDAIVTKYTVDPGTNALKALTYKPDQFGVVSFPAGTYCITSPTGVAFFDYPRSATQTISTLLPFTAVRIHVIDKTGKPISGVRIYPEMIYHMYDPACHWSPLFPGPWTQTTDASGSAKLSKLPQGYDLQINISDDRYVADTAAFVHLAKANTTPDTIFHVMTPPHGSISGTLLFGPTKTPVAGIQVDAVSNRTLGSSTATTDKNGQFSFTKLTDQNYTIDVTDITGMLPGQLGINGVLKDWICLPNIVKIQSGGRTKDIKLILVHGALITGKITDHTTGKPLPDLEVISTPLIKAASNLDYGAAWTNSAGVYKMRVIPGKIRIAPMKYYQLINYTPPKDTEATEGATITANFQIGPPAPEPPHGVVLYPSGKPAPEADVLLVTSRQIERLTTTDTHGRFTLEARGFKYGEELVARSGNVATAYPTPLARDSQYTLNLVPGSLCTIKGDVKDQDLNLLPRALVTLSYQGDDGTTEIAQTLSNAQGVYAFHHCLNCLRYIVQVGAQGYTSSTSSTSDETDAPSGTIVPIPTIYIGIANRSISGTLEDAQGEPVAGAAVSSIGRPSKTAITDRTGHFTINSVPPGNTWVTARATDGRMLSQMLKFGTHDNVMTFGAILDGTVLDPKGKPVSGAQVAADVPNQLSELAITDNTGHFKITSPGLKSGDTVRAQLGTLRTAAPFRYNGQNQIVLQLTAAEMVNIKCQIDDESGAPIPHAYAILSSIWSTSSNTVECDDKGQCTFPSSFGDTEYTLLAWAPGYVKACIGIKVGGDQTEQVPPIKLGIADSFVAGTLVDSTGRPITNATVVDEDVIALETTTDSRGYFMLKGVPRNRTNVQVGPSVRQLTSGRTGIIIQLPKPANH